MSKNTAADIIHLHHGSGGQHMTALLNDVIFKHLDNPTLATRHDGAFLNLGGGTLAFSTDSYVISPIFFKGGNIGELAVNGTVNDLSMCGAEPKYLSLAFIIEEGLSLAEFEQIVISIKNAAQKAGVQVVTGDTKVVERGKGDKIYINTSGIGAILPKAAISAARIADGDVILVNGSLAAHGMAIMSQREGLSFESEILSDTTNLNFVVKELIETFGDKIKFLRDATRGGLASVLNEIATDCQLGINLLEKNVEVETAVKSACELLGLDPVYVANEGVFVCIAEASVQEDVLAVLRKYQPTASILGNVTEEHPSKVIMTSAFGGKRVVNPLVGEQLPRIC